MTNTGVPQDGPSYDPKELADLLAESMRDWREQLLHSGQQCEVCDHYIDGTLGSCHNCGWEVEEKE